MLNRSENTLFAFKLHGGSIPTSAAAAVCHGSLPEMWQKGAFLDWLPAHGEMTFNPPKINFFTILSFRLAIFM